MKLIVSVIATLLIVTIANAQPQRGEVAPEIKLPNAKGTVVSLSSLKGKIVLIDFWASWCGPCRRTVPAMRELYKKYHNKGFEIYGISVDADKNDWKRAVFEDGIKWMQVNDADGKVATEWRLQYIPNTYLLDKNGKVVSINASEQQLEELLQKLLG
ncbi:MAG: TlpA family protein disulfide reductase [Ilyomonas sp.]